ncbi:hypothetical protein CL614_03025 [archaeon]|nr:hypothetical protein [archaeon]|tara:strand:- start:2911 stop:4452 length:1542 start_codon:yes stop_codon:yes gene_type:complete
MLNLNQISIIFPNGNERIFGRQLEISWNKAHVALSDKFSTKEIEVFFTDNYIDDQKTSWSRIARVPYSADKFIWSFGDRFRSENCRVAVRVVNSTGGRTKLFKSASNFSIYRSSPKPPSVVSPSRSVRYSGVIPIVLDYQGIIGSSGGRDRIFIYYRSTKRNIPLTAIVERVEVGTGPMNWDVSDLPNSDDYEIIIFASDDYGNRSDELVIKDVSIFNEGYFIRDFSPPEGFMIINNGDDYTLDTRVRIKLFAYDEATGVHGLKFAELDPDNPDEALSVTSPLMYSEDAITSIRDEDGKSIVSAIIQDFGGNRIEHQSDPDVSGNEFRNFRSLLKRDSGLEVVDVLSISPSGEDDEDVGGIYFITKGSRNALFEMSLDNTGLYSELAELPMECNVIADFLNTRYISGVSNLKNLNLLRYNGDTVDVVYTLFDVESEIVSMRELNGILYIGSLNGDLHKFDGVSLSLDSNLGGVPYFMSQIGSHLYILIKNTNRFFIHNGISIKQLDMESNIIN